MWRIIDGPKLTSETGASNEMGDSGWNERCLSYWCWLVYSSWGDPTLGTSRVFVVHVSRKGSLIEDSECGCLKHHARVLESWDHLYGLYKLMYV